MGNTLMCSHFANRGERSAVNVQLVGILNNMLVLLQAREGVQQFASCNVVIFGAVPAWL
jgi:hypothetical protein